MTKWGGGGVTENTLKPKNQATPPLPKKIEVEDPLENFCKPPPKPRLEPLTAVIPVNKLN